MEDWLVGTASPLQKNDYRLGSGTQTKGGVVGINPYLFFGLPPFFQKGTLTKGEVTIEDRRRGVIPVGAQQHRCSGNKVEIGVGERHLLPQGLYAGPNSNGEHRSRAKRTRLLSYQILQPQ